MMELGEEECERRRLAWWVGSTEVQYKYISMHASAGRRRGGYHSCWVMVDCHRVKAKWLGCDWVTLMTHGSLIHPRKCQDVI